MAKAQDVGTGSSVAFGTTAFEADFDLQGFDFDGFERATPETTAMDTAGARTYIVGDLYDPPTATATVIWNPDEPAPYDQPAETVTWTFPTPSGKSTGATMAGSAAIVRWGATIQIEELMTATVTVKHMDDITFADSSV